MAHFSRLPTLGIPRLRDLKGQADAGKSNQKSTPSRGTDVQDTLREFKAENALLGRVLQECQAQCQSLEKQVAREKKRCSDTYNRSQQHLQKSSQAEQQAAEAIAERDKLMQNLASQTLSLRRLKKRERQLEDLVLELRDGEEATSCSLLTAEQDAVQYRLDMDEALRRADRANDQAHALRGQLQEVRDSYEGELSTMQLEARCLAERLQKEASEAVQAAQAESLQRAHESGLHVASLEAEAVALRVHSQQMEEKLQETAEELAAAKHTVQQRQTDAEAASASVQELSELRKRNHRLQEALVDHHLPKEQETGARSFQENEELHDLHEACAELTKQRNDALSQLQQKAASTWHTKQALAIGTTSMETVRSDVVRLVQRLGTVVAANADLLYENSLLVEQVQAAENALAQARHELATSLQAFLTLESSNLQEMCQQAAVKAAAKKSQPPGGLSSPGPTSPTATDDQVSAFATEDSNPLAALCQMLEHANQEYQAQIEKVKCQYHESCELESRSRDLLSEARSRELVACRRLVQEAERVHSLEGLRLTDVRQLHELQQQLQQSLGTSDHQNEGEPCGLLSARDLVSNGQHSHGENKEDRQPLQPLEARQFRLKPMSDIEKHSHLGSIDNSHPRGSGHQYVRGMRVPQRPSAKRLAQALDTWDYSPRSDA